MKLSKEQIKEILSYSTMEGRLETGYYYWLGQYIMLPYKHKLEDYASTIRDIMSNTEGCFHPSEDTFSEYQKQLNTVIDRIFNSPLNI